MTYKSIIKWVVFLGIVAFVWIHYTRYFDFGNKCYIKIIPSYLEFSNANIIRAIDVLKNGSPSDYQELCQYVKVIDPSPSCGGFGGGCFYKNEEKKIYIQTAQNDLLNTSAIIVHELCHAKQQAAGKSLDENECYHEDDRILKSLTQF